MPASRFTQTGNYRVRYQQDQTIFATLSEQLSLVAGLLLLLMHVGLGHTPAKSLSFVAGTLTAYLINRRWTFAAEPSKARFLAVMGLYAVMFGVQVGLFSLLVPWFLDSGWTEFWAATVGYVIAQGVATVTNFVIQRTVIFRVR